MADNDYGYPEERECRRCGDVFTADVHHREDCEDFGDAPKPAESASEWMDRIGREASGLP